MKSAPMLAVALLSVAALAGTTTPSLAQNTTRTHQRAGTATAATSGRMATQQAGFNIARGSGPIFTEERIDMGHALQTPAEGGTTRTNGLFVRMHVTGVRGSMMDVRTDSGARANIRLDAHALRGLHPRRGMLLFARFGRNGRVTIEQNPRTQTQRPCPDQRAGHLACKRRIQ